jgi:MFS family permease
MVGRFGWSSVSDRIGRKPTYAIFFLLGAALYLCLPLAGRQGSVSFFVAACAAIMTMYGGGFATIPAYLSDLFGTRYVGAIHGRLLTAWSLAGFLGPQLLNALRQARLDAGAPPPQVYDLTMYLMAGLLLVGLCCNLAVRPVASAAFSAAEIDPRAPVPVPPAGEAAASPGRSAFTPALLMAWAAVLIPLAWGVAMTVLKAAQLF